MGLSFAGSILWFFGIAASLAWPGLAAIVFTRWRWSHLPAPERFLRIAIPVSYAVILCSHAVLADFVLTGAERAAETGLVSAVWWRLVFVLMLETALAAAAMYGLERYLRAQASSG